MFISMKRCAEPMTQLSRLKVKVTVKVIGFSLEFCVRSISPLPLEGFLLNFQIGEMFILIETVCRIHDSNAHTQSQGHS